TEEIPASYLRPAAEQMSRELLKFLDDSLIEHGSARIFYTPRRLAVLCENVASKQKDTVLEASGPATSSAYDKEGKPTKAAVGFARAHGVDVNALETKKTPKGEVIVARKKKKGESTSSLVSEYIPKLLATLTFPRTMTWEPSRFRFARPIRWMVALLGRKVVKFDIAGVKSGNSTQGHRSLSPGFRRIENPESYERILKAKHVVADPQKRRKLIISMVRKAATRKGGTPIDDPLLLEEVSCLVEDPRPIVGNFDRKYLSLPKDVVVTAMREHQKYFSIVGKSGRLLPYFVAIANGKPRTPSRVRKAHQGALMSKLEDASFHWKEDTKRTLEDMAHELKRVVWQENLGSLCDKSRRLVELAKHISLRIDDADSKVAQRAAFLCKADLVSNMVRDGKEFAKLQGVMGREYALVSGEDKRVAAAIYEHYLPRYPGDLLPQTAEGAIVSLADRLDSIVGLFIKNKIPTGSEDPYGLRRLANGMIAIIVQGRRHLSLTSLIALDTSLYESQNEGCVADRDALGCSLLDFFTSRMESFLEEKGIRYDIADAVMAPGLDDLYDAAERARALSQFRQSEEFRSLVVGQKRVVNILKGVESEARLDESILAEPEEKRLFSLTKEAEQKLQQSIAEHAYQKSLSILLSLKDPIDQFFDAVLVMAEDKVLRANRLALVKYVADNFNTLADFSKILID
ncbi:MAG: glycine--tRNA ligase subunit beta, partial [bacterium]